MAAMTSSASNRRCGRGLGAEVSMRILAETAERSIVTVLAVDTVNSTGHIAGDDPDDAQELLDRIFEHLDGTIRRAGGLMVNYSGDGGIAVFGWPNSMEDHADRACETAWLIQHPDTKSARIRDMLNRPIRFRVGIHSGLVGLRRMDMQIGSRARSGRRYRSYRRRVAEDRAARQHLRELQDRRTVPVDTRAHAARRRQDPETDQRQSLQPVRPAALVRRRRQRFAQLPYAAGRPPARARTRYARPWPARITAAAPSP